MTKEEQIEVLTEALRETQHMLAMARGASAYWQREAESARKALDDLKGADDEQ